MWGLCIAVWEKAVMDQVCYDACSLAGVCIHKGHGSNITRVLDPLPQLIWDCLVGMQYFY